MSLALTAGRVYPATILRAGFWRGDGDGPKKPAERETGTGLPVLPSTLIRDDKVLGSAYYDTLSILDGTGPCSNFFGGPTALPVFNSFMGHVKKELTGSNIGIRMKGSYINVVDAQTKTASRLFDSVLINTNGPFYRTNNILLNEKVRGIGSFQANSREVRVLMLLHELGHLIKDQEGKWLLPDDGKDEELSRTNSRKIEDICGSEIKAVTRTEAPNLARRKQPEQKLALVDNH
jgi:hypothetical protein